MSTQLGKTVAEPVSQEEQLDYHALNAMLNLYSSFMVLFIFPLSESV